MRRTAMVAPIARSIRDVANWNWITSPSPCSQVSRMLRPARLVPSHRGRSKLASLNGATRQRCSYSVHPCSKSPTGSSASPRPTWPAGSSGSRRTTSSKRKDRLAGSAQVEHHGADMPVRPGGPRPQGGGSDECIERAFPARERHARLAEMSARADVGRIDGQGMAKGGGGFLMPAQLRLDDAPSSYASFGRSGFREKPRRNSSAARPFSPRLPRTRPRF